MEHIDVGISVMALDESEYIKEESGPIKEKEDAWFKSGLPLNKEFEKFDWMQKLGKKSGEEHTYFTYVNQNRKAMKAGDQAFYCYGDRTNSFLL